jgi:hypothetical protein
VKESHPFHKAFPVEASLNPLVHFGR